jgi:putative endonuclease
MTNTRLALGKRGEDLAAETLLQKGYELIERNYRCAYGEIDLVTRQKDVWVFVEVRTRRGKKFGSPEESVTPKKKKHLVDTVQTYLQEHQLTDAACRIDFVAVEFSTRGELLRVEIIEDAVSGS